MVGASLLLARTATIEAYGLFHFVLAGIGFVVLILCVGADESIRQIAARATRASIWGRLVQSLDWMIAPFGRQLLLVVILVGVVVAIAFGAAQVRTWPMTSRFDLGLLGLSLAAAALLGALGYLQQYLQLFAQRFAEMPLQLFFPLFLLALLFGCLRYTEINLALALTCVVAAAGFSLLLAWMLVIASKHKGVLSSGTPVVFYPASFSQPLALPLSLPLSLPFWLALAQLFLGHAGVIILGLLRGPEDVGLYAAAVQLVALPSLSLLLLGSWLGVRLVSAITAQDRLGVRRGYRLQIRLNLCALALLVPGLWVLSPELLAVFGPKFTGEQTLSAFRVLLVAQALVAFGIPAITLMVAVGLQKQALVILGMAGLVNLVLNLALISRLGLIGAAVATAAALGVQSLIAWWFVRRSGLG